MKIYRISKYILVCLLTSGHWNILVPVRADQDASATTQAENVKKTPFELDIKKSSGTKEFDYKKDGKVVTFTAKGDYAFNVVKQGNTEIWKDEDEKSYAIKVVLIGKGKKEKIVIIYLLNGTKKSYKKDGKNKLWTEYDSSQKIPVSISSEIGLDTPFYTYKKEDGCETFTPKEGFVFNEVMYTLGTSRTMWKTTNEAEYANKVELECKRAKIHLEDEEYYRRIWYYTNQSDRRRRNNWY
ncbi:hypothetical protein MACK_002244 [Theileria orientalis]|uniref:Uncharacterized protein n=1 Tax=Theileria orientalis TaxID=68886 RepID=A0A976MBA8_THEOR|nr:hypothetical protein MACK_002244 [Theileria orientalis]